MEKKEKIKAFNIPAFHVHVYKVVSMCEWDMFNEDEKDSIEGALHLARRGDDKEKIKKADCEYVAISFPFPKNANTI